MEPRRLSSQGGPVTRLGSEVMWALLALDVVGLALGGVTLKLILRWRRRP